MTRFIMIDDYTGFVWGEATAETPMEACRILDQQIGAGYERTYHEGLNGHGGGYHCHEAPADFPEVTDGQDEAQIAAVSALPRAAIIGFELADEEI